MCFDVMHSIIPCFRSVFVHCGDPLQRAPLIRRISVNFYTSISNHLGTYNYFMSHCNEILWPTLTSQQRKSTVLPLSFSVYLSWCDHFKRFYLYSSFFRNTRSFLFLLRSLHMFSLIFPYLLQQFSIHERSARKSFLTWTGNINVQTENWHGKK